MGAAKAVVEQFFDWQRIGWESGTFVLAWGLDSSLLIWGLLNNGSSIARQRSSANPSR
jgi:hypothetical protein